MDVICKIYFFFLLPPGVSLDCLEADDRHATVAVLGSKLMRHPTRYSMTVHIEERTGVIGMRKRHLSGTAIFPTSGSSNAGMLLVPCRSSMRLDRAISPRRDGDSGGSGGSSDSDSGGSKGSGGDKSSSSGSTSGSAQHNNGGEKEREDAGGEGDDEDEDEEATGGGGGDGETKQSISITTAASSSSSGASTPTTSSSSNNSSNNSSNSNSNNSSSKKKTRSRVVGEGETLVSMDDDDDEGPPADLVAEIYWRRISVRERSMGRLLCGFFCNEHDPKRWLQAHRPLFPALIRSMHPWAMEGSLVFLFLLLTSFVLWLLNVRCIIPITYPWTLFCVIATTLLVLLVRSKHRATLLQCFDWYRQDKFEITGAAVMDRAYAHALNEAAARQRRQSGRGGEGGSGGEAHRFNTDVNGNIISTDVSTSTQPILYPHERILVQELRRRVRKDCGHAKLYMEPFMLVKFLRARQLNMDRAEKLLRDAVDWRKEHDTVRIIFILYSRG